MGEFNVAMSDKAMENLFSLNNLENLISKPTCYQNHDDSICTDLILTNRPCFFQRSNVFETGISDFRLIILPYNLKRVLKKSYQKL